MNLNLKVDKVKGFQKIVDSSTRQCGDHWEYPYPSDNEEPYYVGPDYQNDWNYLGPLVLELVKSGIIPFFDKQTETWNLKTKGNVIRGSSIDFGKATCLAYLQHKGVEV